MGEFLTSLLSFDIGGTTIMGIGFAFIIEQIGKTSWSGLKQLLHNAKTKKTWWIDLFAAIESSLVRLASPQNRANQKMIDKASEIILSGWKQKGGLRPETVMEAVSCVSSGCSQDSVALWYAYFFEEVAKTNLYIIIILHQLSNIAVMSRESRQLLDQIKKALPLETEEVHFPQYLSDSPFDLTSEFLGRQNKIDEIICIIYDGESVLLSGIGGIGKTEIAKAFVKVIDRTPCSTSGIEYIAWINYNNTDIKLSIVKSLISTRGANGSFEEAWIKVNDIITRFRDRLLVIIGNVEDDAEDVNLRRIADAMQIVGDRSRSYFVIVAFNLDR